MTLDSRRAMPCTASGPGDVRAAGESPVPLRADPFNGAGGIMAGRDRRPRPPEPLYASDRAAVYCGDARDILAGLDKESADLVVVDPPYGVEFQSGMRAERFAMLDGDGAHERGGIREILEHSVRLVGQRRHLYVFGPVDVLDGLKVYEPVEIVWDKLKPGMGDLSARWAPAHERITFAVSAHRHAGRAGRDSLAARMRKGTILRFGNRTGRTVRHPTEKPVALLAELIESSSRQGDLVLDPCAGIGSTGVAAILRGRRTILVEIDADYARAAADRVKAAELLADQMARL
jgi:16S rRNA G966 N2-methylase RsmD